MPYNNLTGVYTPPTGAENAAPGQVIRSATWNSIFTDIAVSQRPTANIIFTATSVNFRSATTDTPLAIALPAGYSNYLVDSLRISGASTALGSATAGMFQSVGGGGATVVALATVTVTTGLSNASANAMNMTVVNAGIQSFNASTLYFRVGQAGATVGTLTATVTLAVRPVS